MPGPLGGIFLTHTVFSAPVCKRSRAVRLCVTLRYFFCKKLNVSSIYEILSPSGTEYPHYVFEILTDHSQRVLNTGGYGDLSTLRASLASSRISRRFRWYRQLARCYK